MSLGRERELWVYGCPGVEGRGVLIALANGLSGVSGVRGGSFWLKANSHNCCRRGLVYKLVRAVPAGTACDVNSDFT